MYFVGVGVNDRWQWLCGLVFAIDLTLTAFHEAAPSGRPLWLTAAGPARRAVTSRRRSIRGPARAWPGSRDFQETRPSDLISTVLGRPLIYRLSVLSILLYAWSNIDAALVFGSAMLCSLVYWHMADPWLNIHVRLSLLSISVFFYFLVFFVFPLFSCWFRAVD